MAQCAYCGRDIRQPMGTVGPLGGRVFCNVVCAYKYYELKLDKTGEFKRSFSNEPPQ